VAVDEAGLAHDAASTRSRARVRRASMTDLDRRKLIRRDA
jgi:hypothetical protein